MDGIEKLPKWAQHEVRVLEMRLREAESKYREALALSELQTSERQYGSSTLVAPTKKTLYFDPDCDGISVMHEKGVLEIRAGWGGSIGIRPVVSNVVTVVTER